LDEIANLLLRLESGRGQYLGGLHLFYVTTGMGG
jgi:hypothetical protein